MFGRCSSRSSGNSWSLGTVALIFLTMLSSSFTISSLDMSASSYGFGVMAVPLRASPAERRSGLDPVLGQRGAFPRSLFWDDNLEDGSMGDELEGVKEEVGEKEEEMVSSFVLKDTLQLQRGSPYELTGISDISREWSLNAWKAVVSPAVQITRSIWTTIIPDKIPRLPSMSFLSLCSTFTDGDEDVVPNFGQSNAKIHETNDENNKESFNGFVSLRSIDVQSLAEREANDFEQGFLLEDLKQSMYDTTGNGLEKVRKLLVLFDDILY
ncbi:hypothetical protein C8R42DRAFT_381424 [Lentinula raphanica]|nr:hypothetical protein C8R42DRAFT_381424 [Lentinula raphanica]